MNTFQVKYGGIPGDITQDEATAFGFKPTSRAGNAAYFPHGDGLIQGAYGGEGGNNQSNYFGSESTLFWQDLSSAGLIAGNFNSMTSDYVTGTLTAQQIPLYVPAAKIGNGTYWAATSSYGMSSAGMNFSNVPTANYYYLGGISGTNGSSEVLTTVTLTVTQAYDIDVKLDDGIAMTGKVLGGGVAGFDSLWAPMLEAYAQYYGPGGVTGGPGSSSCVNFRASYNLANTPADAPACMLSLQF